MIMQKKARKVASATALAVILTQSLPVHAQATASPSQIAEAQSRAVQAFSVGKLFSSTVNTAAETTEQAWSWIYSQWGEYSTAFYKASLEDRKSGLFSVATGPKVVYTFQEIKNAEAFNQAYEFGLDHAKKIVLNWIGDTYLWDAKTNGPASSEMVANLKRINAKVHDGDINGTSDPRFMKDQEDRNNGPVMDAETSQVEQQLAVVPTKVANFNVTMAAAANSNMPGMMESPLAWAESSVIPTAGFVFVNVKMPSLLMKIASKVVPLVLKDISPEEVQAFANANLTFSIMMRPWYMHKMDFSKLDAKGNPSETTSYYIEKGFQVWYSDDFIGHDPATRQERVGGGFFWGQIDDLSTYGTAFTGFSTDIKDSSDKLVMLKTPGISHLMQGAASTIGGTAALAESVLQKLNLEKLELKGGSTISGVRFLMADYHSGAAPGGAAFLGAIVPVTALLGYIQSSIEAHVKALYPAQPTPEQVINDLRTPAPGEAPVVTAPAGGAAPVEAAAPAAPDEKPKKNKDKN